LLGAAAAALIPLGSTIGEEAAALAAKLPAAIQQDPLGQLPLPGWLEQVRPQLTEMLRERAQDLDQEVLPMLSRAGPRILSGLGNVLSAILIPILSFFFLKDGAAMRAALIGAVAESQRPLVAGILSDLDVLLTQYIRALALLAAATFLSHAAFLSLAGAPYSILLAGTAGMLEFIPVAGPLIAAAIILLVAAFTGYPHLLWIVAFLILFRLFQDYVLSPYLMSAGVKIHPMLVLFGVLAGEQVAGIPGMFFSVPLMAALRVAAVRLEKLRHAT
jgi:predicted PurR-regulated permease PerM